MTQQANILLVDDRPENLVALQAMLEDLGQNLVQATSGMEALKHLLERDFAVILLDVQMAGMDGFETAALIKEREKTQHIPIIFVTAYGQTDAHIFKGYSVGAVDYLFKPILPEILRAKVASFVDLYQKTHEIQRQAELIEIVNRDLEAQISKVHQLNRELETTNKELETFSYSVSHDLRAPLRSISGFSQALLEDYQEKLDEQGREYLHWIRASCQQMGELIDDLLQLSRLTSTKMEPRTVDLTRLATQVIDNLCRVDSARKVDVEIQPNLTAQGDERLLRVVLENLLGNAWKFTGKRENAHIEFGRRDGVFYVADNGAGFNMDYADQLFHPFQRLHSEDEFDGHGIGLVTVHRILHRHGGKIWAESVEGQGATFYFTVSD
jgi:two-component system, sensor histidine kinase and response regulator